MKKTLLFLLTIFTFSAATAQGNNLQFNQVVFLEYNSNGNVSGFNNSGQHEINVGTITIPNDKVWKITSASAYSTNTAYRAASILVNEHIVFSNQYYNGTNFQNVPLWLDAGTYTVFLRNQSDQYETLKGTLSAIEFNIVQ